MSELTTQLEQARQEIAEKEVESRNWEERAAGSSQLLKEERTKLEVSLALAVVYVEHWVLYSYIPTSCYNHCRRSQSCRGKL